MLKPQRFRLHGRKKVHLAEPAGKRKGWLITRCGYPVVRTGQAADVATKDEVNCLRCRTSMRRKR